MYYREFYYWCRDAVRKIRYWKDRNKVYAELYEHMLDRYEALLEKGYSEEEAVKKTIDAMGSAEELAPQLAAIHRPHWAYAAILTRGLVLILLCLCIGRGVQFGLDNGFGRYTHSNVWAPYTRGGQERVAYVQPRETAKTDGYTIRVKKAALWRNYYDESVDGKEYFDTLYMDISVFNPLPWMQENAGVSMNQLWAVDSTGARYDQLLCSPRRFGFFTYVYQINLQELQEDISWIELHYDRDGRNMVLRVDLTGGDGS